MRTLAIGDIHGCFTALQTLIAFADIKNNDLVISLGDYIDRGPDSRSVIEWLIHRFKTGKLIALKGNHELMMTRAENSSVGFKVWRASGGEATMASYGLSEATKNLEAIPEQHWNFIKHQTQSFFEIDTHFFVHANAQYDLSLENQPEYELFWEKFDKTIAYPHMSGKIMVCGHTPQRDGLPHHHGHAICIDTWAYKGYWLTCLDVKTGHYWQANQQRETREGWVVE